MSLEQNKAMSALRFGVITLQNVAWKELVRRWQFIEKAGFDTIWVADHFLHWNLQMMPFFEAWSILSALACHTSQIRFGTLVTAMHWRHPAWLAKQALTIDHISNGRLELGLGAGGSSQVEYSMTGVKEWEPREKVTRFKEYVEIVDQLLRNRVTTYHGKYYRLEEAVMQPDPIQKPRPPLTIGAFGPRMLQIAARYADTWNTLGDPISNHENMKTTIHRISLLNKYCKQINRDAQILKRSYAVYEREAIHNISGFKLYESAEIIEDVVKKCLDLGFTEILIPYPLIEEDIPVFEQIAREVIPKLRRL
jgi:alkanesulfonate monooxygenase SsuD/methylene tetrahydromethanopterin reductase-like flavin-dependent oxidoreductase (luciferase family)